MLAIGLDEADSIRESENFRALPGHLERFLRQVDRGHLRARAREIDGVGADAASDLEYLLPAPFLEFRKTGDMRFHPVLAMLDLVEIFFGPRRFGRMADVARPGVPVILDIRQ